MELWRLVEAAFMPILQLLIISAVGAFMATPYSNLLHSEARKSLNKIVFMVFTPSLMFASLAKTVTLEDIISWWFMPVNVGLTFLFGGVLGWAVVRLLKPQKHLEGLVVAASSSGNLGNLMLIIVPAVCEGKGSPFGDHDVCASAGLSYASFSMALGGFYIWTYTYQLMRTSSVFAYNLRLQEHDDTLKVPPDQQEERSGSSGSLQTLLLIQGGVAEQQQQQIGILVVHKEEGDINKSSQHQTAAGGGGGGGGGGGSGRVEDKLRTSYLGKVIAFLHQILEELLAPPTLAAIVGVIFGATQCLKNLIIGDNAPLRVFQDSLALLGDGTIPCITLILGGNLTRGLRSSKLKASMVIGVVCVRCLMLPLIGIGVVRAAGRLGFLPADPLYHYVLMIQFTLPPAMNISTMAELFDVGQEECSVLVMWTYLVAAFALTLWPTVYMWVLS